MDELLKKLLEAEVLTEETRAELHGAFQKQLDEAMASARAEATATVTAELNEQWINDREILIEALDSKVTEALTAELAELHAFFAGDAMVAKVRQMAQQLREMGASLEADSAEGQLRATQDAAMRSVRDRADIFEDGGNLIRLGRHR